MRGHRDLRQVVVAATVCALVAALVPVEVVRILAALPLTLFLPGYAIVAAAFGRRRIAPARILLLSLAMSLAALAIGGLVLSLAGIYRGTWAALLVLIVVAASAVAARRRGRPPRRARGETRRRLRKRDLALLGGAVALMAVAVALAQAPFAARKAEGYTALWMLPGRADRSVEVGVAGATQAAAGYVLYVRAGAGAPVVRRAFELDPGEERVFRVPVPPRARSRVTASLFEASRPDHLYRRVTSYLPAERRP